MFNGNNRSYLSLGLLFKDTPHLVIDLWRTQVKDLLQQNYAKTPEEERNFKKNNWCKSTTWSLSMHNTSSKWVDIALINNHEL